MFAMRTKQTLDFPPLLTQHYLADVADLLLQCSLCRQSGRSTLPILANSKPAFRCGVFQQSRRGTKVTFRCDSMNDRFTGFRRHQAKLQFPNSSRFVRRSSQRSRTGRAHSHLKDLPRSGFHVDGVSQSGRPRV